MSLSNDALYFKGTREEFATWVVDHPDTRALLNSLDYRPRDRALFLQAFTHTSFLHERPEISYGHSERLEFLGDALVGFYFSQRLFCLFPDWREGKMSRLRSALVNRGSLGTLADFAGLPRVLLLGKGELAKEDVEGTSLPGNAFEALIGAILMDGGESNAFQVLDHLLENWKRKKGRDFIDLDLLEEFDAKSRLQEICVQLWGEAPFYQTKETEPGTFQVGLFVAGEKLAEVTGNSKRRAQKELAELALKEGLHKRVEV